MTKFSLSSFSCLFRSVSTVCRSHVCVWPWLSPAETQKIGWMREWKSWMIEAEEWEMEGFSLWRPCALAMRYPNTISFFSLCIVFSLSLSVFFILSVSLGLPGSFLIIFLLKYTAQTFSNQSAMSCVCVCVSGQSLFDRVYFFIHIFLCCSLSCHMSKHPCVLYAQFLYTLILCFCQCTR